jgi:phosphohistidine phosphatase
MTGSKRLYVLRHTKSSWDDPMLDDHDRPLAPRGRKAARLIGEHIREAGIRPELVLCSSSRRTRETLDAVAPGGETLIERELYEATCGEVMERLRRIPPGTASVMLVGHNPTAQTLVLRLAGADGDEYATGVGTPVGDELVDVQRKFPTGALATLSFDFEWAELCPGCAALLAYVRPKSLS